MYSPKSEKIELPFKNDHPMGIELLYNPTQSAYRRGHSTETALLCVLNYIQRAIDRGEISLLALLVQTAAFDLLDHPTLLHRLKHRYGICGIVLLWLKS